VQLFWVKVNLYLFFYCFLIYISFVVIKGGGIPLQVISLTLLYCCVGIPLQVISLTLLYCCVGIPLQVISLTLLYCWVGIPLQVISLTLLYCCVGIPLQVIGLTLLYCCAYSNPKQISIGMCHGLFCVKWLKLRLRVSCSFCWYYWLNYWSSLFKLSFHNLVVLEVLYDFCFILEIQPEC
jgi:hypothetical protein